MTIKKARAAALLLQQELIDLDVDVELDISNVQLLNVTLAAIWFTVSMIGRGSSRFYIDEHGTAWGNTDSWGVVFAGNDSWNFSGLASKIANRLPTLFAVKQRSRDLLAKIKARSR